MDRIDELRAFVATAKSGSFTHAANQLGVSNRLTSKYVANLEARLGVRLFQRTTRKVGLTPAGQDLLAQAPRLLDEFDELLSEISAGSTGFSGIIRVSAPVTFGEIYIGNMLGRFGEQHPNLSFDLRLNDSFVDLASEGIDIAFRIGQSEMLSIKTRKLGEMKAVVAASPEYIAKYGMPKSPEDLQSHACILDTNRRASKRWAFGSGKSERIVEVNGKFQVNSARAAAQLAASGLGICYVPRFALFDLCDSGELISIMNEFQSTGAPISAVYLEGRSLPKKLRALIDFAQEDIRQARVL